MKSEDLQKLLAAKHENGEFSMKVFRDLNGVISLATIKRWYKMIDKTGSINLSFSSGCPCTARTNVNSNKVKQKLQRKKVSTGKLALELGISSKSAHRILRNDLGCRPYKHVIEQHSPMNIKKKEKSLPTRYEQIFESKKHRKFYFLTKNCLTSMKFIIPNTIVFGL
jgi:transposase